MVAHSISTRVGQLGFWYLIEGPAGTSFYGEYVAIGPGSQHASGSLSGQASSEWQFESVGFAVLRVGLSHVELRGAITESSSPPAAEAILTRRDFTRIAAAAVAITTFGSRHARAGGQAEPAQLEHEVFPQEQFGGDPIWEDPLLTARADQEYPYPYPYPYPHPSPIPLGS